MHKPRIRTAIIGTGGIARCHLNALQDNSDLFDLVAICDVNPDNAEAFRKQAQLDSFYTSIDDMLANEQIDLVQVATPPATHVPISIKLMDAGVNVLCEKPLCGSLQDLQQLAAAEKRTGKWCASVFQFRYGAGTRHLKSLIAKNVLGRPLVGVCHTLWFRDHAYYEVDWRGTWKSELGGPTAGHGIHAMDHFLALMGDWEEVRAEVGTLDRAIEVEDISMAIIRFANGAMGNVINSILSPKETTYLRMDFQKATVELEHLYSYRNENWSFYAAPEMSEVDFEFVKNIPEDNESTHSAQIKALADDILSGRRPETSGKAAEITLDLLTSIYKSAFTGMPVQRGSIQPGDPFYSSFHGGQSIQHRLIKSAKSSYETASH